MSYLTEFLIVVVTILLVPIYYAYSRVYKVRQFLNQFPSPPMVPLLGNAGDFNTPGEFLKKLHEYTRKYGSLVHLRIGIRETLLCTDYKFLEFLLSHNTLLKKTPNVTYLEPWIGTGLVTADGGPKWKIHRKLITPAFHFKILEQFLDVFEADGDILVEKLSRESGKQSVDIYPYVTRCTLDVICETAMGTKVDVQTNEASAYFQSVKEMCRIFAERAMTITGQGFLFRFTKNYALQEKALKILHGYTNRVVQDKRKALDGKSSKKETVDDLGRKRKKAFLDLILEARVDNHSLTDEEIREEVDTFMFAGHDTTATATAFILFCIAGNKEVQDRILEEQQQILGSDKKPEVTYANLQEMKYLENVIKESLRLYPPVPIITRRITQEVEFNGLKIPKEVNVTVFIAGMHMNPQFYPNPEKFDPSRFETMDNKHPFAFIPFSAGPRNCIGQKFAMLEMKSLVSKVVRNFELFSALPRHDLELSPETVLKSLNGVRIGLKLR